MNNGDPLERTLDAFREDYPKLGDDEVFIAWFLRAFVADSPDAAVRALTRGSGDKGVDAVHIDDDSKVCFIVQGKCTRGRLDAHRATLGEANRIV